VRVPPHFLFRKKWISYPFFPEYYYNYMFETKQKFIVHLVEFFRIEHVTTFLHHFKREVIIVTISQTILVQRVMKMKKWLTSICLAVTLLAGFSSVGSAADLSTYAVKEEPQRLPNQH